MQSPLDPKFMASSHHRLPFLLCLLSQSFFSSVHTLSPIFACDVSNDPSAAAYGFCNRNLKVSDRVYDLVGRLTLTEKIRFLVNGGNGVDRLGIPGYEWWSEALHGVSDTGPGVHFHGDITAATSFPQVLLTAASFNTSLFREIGRVVSTEARAMYNVGQGGLTFWSPNVNIFRDPRWGRGQETPGEDPLLSSRYASSYVKGLQKRDDNDSNRLKIAACCKHYTAYDLDNWKEIDRFHFNAMVTKQDMEDTFQPPFKSCVIDGNVASVMCSYNQVNGKPTCADRDLLGVVRDEWGLNGYIVSDCDSLDTYFTSQHYTKSSEEAAAKAILAGLDLNCGSFLARHAENAVASNLVDESAIDTAISHNIATLMRLGFFDGDPSEQLYGNLGAADVCTAAHQELALEAARQGIVLLKNTNGSLPLNRSEIRNLAVIGPNANASRTMLGNYAGPPCKYITPLQGLSDMASTTYEPGCVDVSCQSPQIDDAKDIAASADATIIIVGADQSLEAEGHDRVDIVLPGGQETLVKEVAEVAKGLVILVIMSGGGMDVSFANKSENITSILWVGYPGEAGGAAIADIVFGYYNPSGKLPMTWYPQSFVEKVPMTNMNMRPDEASGYPGRTYRFYTGETVYPFGYGLSYSQYTYHMLHAPKRMSLNLEEHHACYHSDCNSIHTSSQICQNSHFCLKIEVQNTGKLSGSHTVFLFSVPPSVHNPPQKQLVGFEKVFVHAKDSTRVRLHVDVCRDLSVVDETGERRIALGEHILHVGDVKHSLVLNI